MSDSWRRVMVSPFGTPATYLPIGSSSPALPWSTSRSRPVTVKVFVSLPIRMLSPVTIAVPATLSETPKAFRYSPCGVDRLTITPGTEASVSTRCTAVSSRAVTSGVSGSAVGPADAPEGEEGVVGEGLSRVALALGPEAEAEGLSAAGTAVTAPAAGEPVDEPPEQPAEASSPASASATAAGAGRAARAAPARAAPRRRGVAPGLCGVVARAVVTRFGTRS